MVSSSKAQAWYLYLIRCRGGQLYAGITTDLERRFQEHAAGKGAKFLRGKAPLRLEWQMEVASQSEALKLEYRLKQERRSVKEALITKQMPYQPRDKSLSQ